MNGLITELLESIPETAVCLNLNGYYAEIVSVKDNVIRTVKMWRGESSRDTESDG